MMAYTKPQHRRKEESKQLIGLKVTSYFFRFLIVNYILLKSFYEIL